MGYLFLCRILCLSTQILSFATIKPAYVYSNIYRGVTNDIFLSFFNGLSQDKNDEPEDFESEYG